MNYRHIYHAGNFADVFKHIVLIALTKSLLRKETPFCYLDTHAGIGHYDLSSSAAQKSKEFTTGIEKIFSQPNPPELIKEYLNYVKELNSGTKLKVYPGSPYFVRCLLRHQDRMVLSELHDDDHATLKDFFAHDKRVAVHHLDGYQSLKAYLPPKERRGLVLIDPPYEKPDEFAELAHLLPQAIERWQTGIYALWYPIKERRAADRVLQKLRNKISRPLLTVELSVYPEDLSTALNGSGMLIVNPPWQLDLQLKELLPWLWKTLSVQGQGRYQISTANLSGEK